VDFIYKDIPWSLQCSSDFCQLDVVYHNIMTPSAPMRLAANLLAVDTSETAIGLTVSPLA